MKPDPLEKPTWQPIANAPKDRTPVDLWSAQYGRLVNYMRFERTATNVFYDPVCEGVVCVRDATHFMPIPDSPTMDAPQPISEQDKASTPKSAESFYREQLEVIASDRRKTRGQRLASSALSFWDSMRQEQKKQVVLPENWNTQ